jgi:hypothetical protein
MDTPEAQQQDNTLVLDLPPMPTLIPTSDLGGVSSQMVVRHRPSSSGASNHGQDPAE